jgi:D-amino-acid oxidase
MKIAIIGGGIFGITTAITLANNHSIELFEKNSDILQATSGSNQYRVHRGYHYPRSKHTVLGIINSEHSFQNMYGDAIENNYEHYYCISKNDSLTSPKQFLDFCKEFNLDFQKSEISCVNNNSIEFCLKVKESLYDPYKLKELSWKKLKENNVKVNLNFKADKKIFKNFDWVIICTYSNLNSLVQDHPDLQKEYQFEVCEKPVVKLPKSFKNKSIVIMDGPFMCIDPLANTDLHLLCNVVNEIHQTNTGFLPDVDEKYLPLLDRGIIKNPEITNYEKFIQSSIPFFPEIESAEHIGSMFTVRAVPPRVENTDARPTQVTKIDEKTITIFSGKITTCVEAANEVKKIIENK